MKERVPQRHPACHKNPGWPRVRLPSEARGNPDRSAPARGPSVREGPESGSSLEDPLEAASEAPDPAVGVTVPVRRGHFLGTSFSW